MPYSTLRTKALAVAFVTLLVSGCANSHIRTGYTLDLGVSFDDQRSVVEGSLKIEGTLVDELDESAKQDSQSGNEQSGASVDYFDPYEAIYANVGSAYRTVVPWSFYDVPIKQNGQLRGRSRRYGDASHATQRAVIDHLKIEAKRAGMTVEQQAMVLAIAKVESGFNPDAAAGTTSALGIGQFIRKTGEAYGLNDHTRFDVGYQARALVLHTLDNFEAVRNAGLPIEYVYARHHDGNFENSHGGLNISRQRVLPLLPLVLDVIAQTYP